MRGTPSVCLVLMLAADIVSAAPPASTQLEALARSADAVVTHSQRIGSLRAPDALATFTVLAVSGQAGAATPAHGVSVDLTNNAGSDRIYLDANQLDVLRGELDLMVRFKDASFAESRKSLAPGGTFVHGTESCWMPNPEERILCPSAVIGSDWSGIALGAFGGPSFLYRNVEASELLALVDRAITVLGAH
jgi:hypothetical protein